MVGTPLGEEVLLKFRQHFYAEPRNVLAQNVCTKIDPLEACVSRQQFASTQHVFTHKVDVEGKPTTNQKSTGRCWVFAALNVIRLPFMKKYNIDEFEFSQSHLFFWDKIERCNYFLNNIVLTAKRGEPVNGRLVSFLLHDPTSDGGQWDMLVNLINKHGLMPKKNFPDAFSCESSLRMNSILKSKLREYTKVLREMVDADASDEELRETIEKNMDEVFRVVAICLGTPVEKFTFEFYDKSKQYNSFGPVTPLEFYNNYVKPCFNVDDKVCLVTDPRQSNPYNRAYTVDCLGNVVGGRPIVYNNQPVDLLLNLAAESIKQKESVWFGCEVGKRFASKHGIEDLAIHDYKITFGLEVTLGLCKEDRLLYGESMMTHAMNITGVTIQDSGSSAELSERGRCLHSGDTRDGGMSWWCERRQRDPVRAHRGTSWDRRRHADDQPVKFRVENSWGDDRGDKGYLVMTKDWFEEFVFEVVVDRKFVPDKVLEVFEQDPIILPAWDPMGTLAR
ncbi:bleomycin hydrolase isoform X2 [Bacillus rossius redtenbacheri]|uniref:bleomycin hydrolase isoform X2 n=1 Tax=Bacillus rossius redtenbacheri TaxID=93214 RepID=UPI002FDEE9A5